MHNKSYWRNRALEYEAELMQICNADLEPKLASFFRDSLNEIEKDLAALYALYQTDNSLSYSQAKKLLRGNEFSNWRMSLREYVALSHTDSKILKELNTLAMRSRITRLEKLYSETLMHLQNLGENYDAAVKDFLTAAYKERYFHGIYDLAKVGKLEIPLTKVQPAKLEQVLNSKWLGGNYSSRIWKNTEKLSATLKTTITQGLHRGLSVQKLSRELSQKMDVSYRNAERLVRTELNFIQNYSAKESLEAAGLEEYEFIAVLDHRTTPRCQALDGTHHLLEEYSPGTNAPPMHPRCRSTISAIVEGGKRTAKVAGKNVKVPADWNYEKWLGSLKSPKISGTKTVITPLQEKIKAAEDKAFAAKTGADFGFKKLNRASEWSKEIMYSNEGTEKLERAINCQRCVVAHEARLRGYDVTSRPSYGANDELRNLEKLLEVFERKNPILKLSKEELAGDIQAETKNIIKTFGKGARAFVWFKWKDKPEVGHVIVAECKEGGVVNVGDPQSKERAAIYKLNSAIAESICVMRVDDLEFTDLIKRFCMNRGGKNGNT